MTSSPFLPRPPASLLINRHWPFLFPILAPLLLFSPFLLGWQVMYWGTPIFQFYPWQEFALATMRAGQLPLWNPYLGNGAPLIANYQSAVFYPPNWLMLFIPHDYGMGLLVTLHLIWAGVGMVALARAVGLQPLGQAVAGVAFGLSQYLVARVGFFSINAAAAWLPWVILAGERLITSNYKLQITNYKSLLSLSFCLTFQLLSGHAQTTWYTLLLLAAWALWRLITPSPLHLVTPAPLLPRSLAPLLLLSLSILFAFALAALQLLPTAELLRQSPRANSADYEFVMTYSYSPWRLLTLFAPDLLGHPAIGKFYGYGNYWEDANYIGLLPLLLALGVILRYFTAPLPPRSRAPLPTFLALVLSVFLLLALGRNTPVFPFLYKYIPTFNLFQAPTRFMLLVTFALTLLAGWGADHWQPPQGWGLYWTRLGAAGAVSVIIISALTYYNVPATTPIGAQIHTIARAIALLGLGLFITALLFLLPPRSPAPLLPRSFLWQLSVVTFVALDLLFANFRLTPGAPPDLYRQPADSTARLQAALGGHRLFQYPSDEYALKYSRYASFFNFGPTDLARALREDQLANVNLLDGLPSANNFDPLLSARYFDYLNIVSDTRSLDLLRLMDVAIIISSVPRSDESVGAGSATTFYLVPGDVRRVRAFYSTHAVPDAASARAALLDPGFDPLSTVILEPAAPLPPSPPSPHTCLASSPNCFTTTATLTATGYLLLADTYYPGWLALVDGQPVPIHPANLAFRAVPVPAGSHTITFIYQPRSFLIGVILSGLAWLFFLALLIVTRLSPSPLLSFLPPPTPPDSHT